MMLFLIQALYYFLPAYVSNMAPVLFKKINIFPQPVDLNHTWKGKLIFGSHKTWGGLLYATLAGTLVFYLQKLLYAYPFFQELSLFDYTQQSLWLGILLASGAILGDLIKSFVKRRLSKKPGAPWFPFDQLDFVAGAFLFSFFIYVPPARVMGVIIITAPVLHYAANYVSYVLRLKTVRW